MHGGQFFVPNVVSSGSTEVISNLYSEIRSYRRRLEGQQIFYEVALFLFSETQLEKLIVVIDYIPQCGEPAVMIETALLVTPQTFQWCGSVSPVRSPIRLKIVNTDLSRRVHVPARLRENRRYMTSRAFRLTEEYYFPTLQCRSATEDFNN